MNLVPDTSVLVDGRITELIAEKEFEDCRILVPHAALAELEAQANRGLETGFAGLDELSRLQQRAKAGDITVEMVGQRPAPGEIEAAARGAIDARIRQAAVDFEAIFVTSDRVQAHAAEAQGLNLHYIRPVVEEVPDLTQLKLWAYFDETTMSVHLKADCRPMVKKGTPAGLEYVPVGTTTVGHKDIRALVKECIEFATRDYNSFVELERHGCTVLQMGPMRVTIAQPPFSDALEVTAVRPVFKATLADYDLPPQIMERIEGVARGVFIAGPPGSGKSTFAAALAEHLHGMDRVVKTMEQPRDLQVPKEITQYGALDRDMARTGEILLLVRPDHVVYDEVRTTSDFRVFADMRMAGIGLFGVTHASRPIDAVQRLIGRVELGMIPQIVDTIVYIDKGRVATLLELRFTVKTPEGMVQEDLARPVVLVKDLTRNEDVFELYTYGEQVVVMPVGSDSQFADPTRPSTGAAALAEKELHRALGRHVKGRFETQIRGDKATIMVEEWEVPGLIGKGGRTVQALEARLGIRLDIKPFSGRAPPGRGGAATRGPEPRVQKRGSNIYVELGDAYGARDVKLVADGRTIAKGFTSRDGRLRFKSGTDEAEMLARADKAGWEIKALAK